VHDHAGVPEGWTLTTLGELCTAPQYGWTTSAHRAASGPRLLRTSDISGGTVDWSQVPGCDSLPDDLSRYLLAPGDIVVSRAGSVGVSYLIRSCPEAIFASYLIRFRPVDPISAEFVAFFLRSPSYWQAIADQTTGIAIPNVNGSKLSQLEIPLPPLAEQRRIVAQIEVLLARTAMARERLTGVTTVVRRLRQSVLAAAVAGRLTADWREANLGTEPASELLSRVDADRRCAWALDMPGRRYREPEDCDSSGMSDLPSTWVWSSLAAVTRRIGDADHKMPRASSEGLPYVSTRDFVGAGEIDYSNAKKISVADFAGITKKIRPEFGDILLSRYGTVGLVRRILRTEPFQASYSLAIIKTLPSSPSTDYLVFALRSEVLQEQMRRDIRASSQPDLGLEYIRRFAVPMPPLAEQHEIVRRVEALFALADAVERRVETATVRAEKLTQAILAKAFRGELVPTEAELARREGRGYEPASVLLERVRAARAQAGDGSRGLARAKRAGGRRQRLAQARLPGVGREW
jgi:type I restriction enzyme S subunit